LTTSNELKIHISDTYNEVKIAIFVKSQNRAAHQYVCRNQLQTHETTKAVSN